MFFYLATKNYVYFMYYLTITWRKVSFRAKQP
jgi:hypothetical protein